MTQPTQEIEYKKGSYIAYEMMTVVGIRQKSTVNDKAFDAWSETRKKNVQQFSFMALFLRDFSEMLFCRCQVTSVERL